MTIALTCRTCVFFALYAVGALSIVRADYVDDVLRRYPNVLVVSITSANAVSNRGVFNACGYRYEGRINENILGKIDASVLPFSSAVQLKIGQRYLLFFSPQDAKQFRRLKEEFHTTGDFNACKRKTTGFTLLYNEINEVGEYWSGSSFEIAVVLSDRFADFPNARTAKESVVFTNLSDIKEVLRLRSGSRRQR